MHPCAIVPVRNEQFEKDFHRLVSTVYPHAVCDGVRIGGALKDELYLCDREVVNEFAGIAAHPPSAPARDAEGAKTKPKEELEMMRERERTQRMLIQLHMMRSQL